MQTPYIVGLDVSISTGFSIIIARFLFEIVLCPLAPLAALYIPSLRNGGEAESDKVVPVRRIPFSSR